MNRHLSLLLVWVGLLCASVNSHAQDHPKSCKINYKNLLLQAKNGDFHNIEKQLLNKKLIVEKRRNQIFRKFGLDSKASVYYDSQLEITVQNVRYQHGQLLLQYSPKFFLIVDDFADFAIYENYCRPQKKTATHTIDNHYAAVSYRKNPSTVYHPAPGILKRTYHYPHHSSAQKTAKNPITKSDNSPKIGVSATYVQRSKPQKDTKIGISPPYIQRSKVEAQSTKSKTKGIGISGAYTLAEKSTTVTVSTAKKGITNSSKKTRKARINRNLAELFWGNPIEGDFIKGCANGKCTFDPNAVFVAPPPVDQPPVKKRKHFSNNSTSTDILINKSSNESALNCKDGVCVQPITQDDFMQNNIFGQQCIEKLSDGSRCPSITQWGRCDEH